MTLRTSLIITGDTEGAQASVRDLAKEMDGAGVAAQRLGNAERQAEAATGSLSAEMRQAAAAAAGVAGANDNVSRSALQLFAAEQRLEAALAGVERAHRQAAAAADDDADAQLRVRQSVAAAEASAASASAALLRLQQGQRGAVEAGDDHVRSMGQQRQGAFMLGQQVQDMGVQLSMGTGIMQVLAMQAGQTAMAIDQMGAKGAAGRVAAFFMSPWGAAIMAGVMVLGPLVAQLFETEEAMGAVELASNSLSDAQSVLGDVFDLQTGKIKNNTTALILNAQAKALNMRAEAAQQEDAARGTLSKAGQPTLGSIGSLLLRPRGAVGRGDQALDGNLAVRNLARIARTTAEMPTDTREQQQVRADRFRELMRLSDKTDFAGSGIDKTQFQQALVDTAAAESKRAIADLIDKSLDDGQLASELRRPSGKKPSKPGSTAGRDEFGRDAADTIAGIAGRYSESARPFQQAAGEIRKLDDLIEDLGRKKPPNFEALIASAEDAKITVQQGLIRTIADAFAAPETLGDKAAKAIGDLDAMMADLEKRQPPGFEKVIEGARAAKGAITEGLMRPYYDYIDAQDEQIEIQDLILAGKQDEADAQRIINGLKKQGIPLDEAKVQRIKEQNAELRQQQIALERNRASQQKYLSALDATRSTITGIIANPQSIAQAPEALLGTFRQLSAEYLFEKMFGNVFEQLQDEITGNGAVQRSAMKTSSSLDKVASSANRAANALAGVANPEEIVVTGSKSDQMTPSSLFERMFREFGKGLGISDQAADKIGKLVGKGFEGAMQGQMASGVASMLGIKQSNTGAAIGGAIGNLIPGLGPLGGILGGLLGGTIGGLFIKPPSGTASVTSTTGDASVTGTNGEMRRVAGGLADQVQGGLRQIAEQLGGSLGSFSVSIGTFDGKYRVNTDATNRSLNYNNFNSSTLHNFDDDAAAAVGFAIADAVRDGAVSGLSAAVQKAIRSSTDIEAALEEALKVADLELILGGVDAEMIRAFKSFEAQAKDRLRIATEYGFDVVEVEKLNAKERLELTNRFMEQQVGSLQRLVNEMTSGSMFEGTKVEQRDRLLTEIARAQADLDAGVEGSADRLAQLFEQLNAVSREVYGTTGGFATDRNAILDQARAAIARANADAVSAQERASDPALQNTNAALDENNDQNAQIIDSLRRNNELTEEMIGRFGFFESIMGTRAQLRDLAGTS